MIKMDNDWDKILKGEFEKEYFKNLQKFLKSEYENKTIFPEMNNIFNAFKLTSYKDCKVVILGQDPYIKKGQAHGLSFSVKDNVTVPPSLKNVYKEIESDLNIKIERNGNLTSWAKQGILLLNTTLTVEIGKSNSHKGHGWEIFTNNVITILNDKKDPVVFMLWGNNAIDKKRFISNEDHIVLTAKHPSPLARGGFFGCKHFSKCNAFLEKNGLDTINW